jgi:hypothetical protein
MELETWIDSRGLCDECWKLNIVWGWKNSFLNFSCDKRNDHKNSSWLIHLENLHINNSMAMNLRKKQKRENPQGGIDLISRN